LKDIRAQTIEQAAKFSKSKSTVSFHKDLDSTEFAYRSSDSNHDMSLNSKLAKAI
jgi:hypothetical protein